MSRQEQGDVPQREHWFRSVQVRCSQSLGVSLRRRRELYQELIEAVSLKDTSYWLQILFAAGIATLGLVMNSSAVIIGAMLISPLMGTILANGLAFAAGDFILAVRGFINLALSCAVAIGFAIFLVACLPFKDMTPEILGRTQPNLLDLVIAIFSGALAAVMTAKDHKGAMNSIPGVAIAVALMPPLCVVGYGIGVALSLNSEVGFRTAFGGGLLFLTNLAAITLMAMVVFTLLRIDTFGDRDEVDQWHAHDPESKWLEKFLKRFEGLKRLRVSGSLFSRFVVLTLPLMILLIPLTQSFGKLSQDITRKQRSNELAQTGRKVWEKYLSKDKNGQERSIINQFLATEQAEQLTVQMTVFTSRPYDPDERQQYKALLAEALKRDPASIQLRLLEIPTASYELLQLPQEDNLVKDPAPPTIAQKQADFLASVNAALAAFQFPDGKTRLDYRLMLRPGKPLGVNVLYLAESALSADAASLLRQNLRERLKQNETDVQFEWVQATPKQLQFNVYGDEIDRAGMQQLDEIGKLLRQYKELYLEVTLPPTGFEPEDLVRTRFQAIQRVLKQRSEVEMTRVKRSAKQSELEKSNTRSDAPVAQFRIVSSQTQTPSQSTESDQSTIES